MGAEIRDGDMERDENITRLQTKEVIYTFLEYLKYLL